MIKQFLGYAIPSALAMCVASLNTIIDGVFLGNGIGNEALAAVNIVMPITIVFFGLATMVSVGGGALISKYFGAKEDEKAVSIFRQVNLVLLIISSTLSVIFFVFAKDVVKIMGATKSIEPLATEYLRYYAVFGIPGILGLSYNSFLRNDNKPKLAMISTIAGTISNVILNYTFIFILGLGIKSAAIATGLGQIVTLLIAMPHFVFKKGRLSFGKQRIEWPIVKEIFNIGLPSFFAETAFSIIIFVHNIVLVNTMGDLGISIYAIINYLTTSIYMILLGVTLGAQPLISYNYGARESEKMIKFYKYSNITSVAIGVIFAVMCLLFGKTIIGIFTSDQSLIELSYVAVNINNVAYLFIGINLTTTMYYQAIEIPKYSNIICALRSIIVLPIILIVFSKTLGSNGIWISMAVSELIILLIISKSLKVNKYTSLAIRDALL